MIMKGQLNLVNIKNICLILRPDGYHYQNKLTFGVEVFLSIIFAESASCVSRSGTSGKTFPPWLCIFRDPEGSNGVKSSETKQNWTARYTSIVQNVFSCKFMQVIMVSQNLRLVYNNCLFWCFLIRLCSVLVDYVFFYQLIKLELDIGSLQGLNQHFLNLYSLRFYDYIKTAAIMNHVRIQRRGRKITLNESSRFRDGGIREYRLRVNHYP